jgi:hypothetical protein
VILKGNILVLHQFTKLCDVSLLIVQHTYDSNKIKTLIVIGITPFLFHFLLTIKLYAGDIFLQNAHLNVKLLIVCHHSSKTHMGA